MRVLLDENIPVQLKRLLTGHDVRSINDKELGWKQVKNGELLARMEGVFDVLVTADKNIYAQQNLTGRRISIVILPTNRRSTVLNLAANLLGILSQMTPGRHAIVAIDGRVEFRGPSSSL